MFRFDYQIDFLRWILCPPNFIPSWHLGIRAEKNEKLLAFITGVPVKMMVKGKEVKMAEINYLCVHKKLRAKRLAPVLIREITRRVNLKKIWQAVYTAGVEIPKPIATARYFHRNLNVKKLVDVQFTTLNPGSSMSLATKKYKLPAEPLIPGF
jgi:glycylpeptide N-tetradecanoyltransferase